MYPAVPRSRIRILNQAPLRPEGAFVLYWMTAQRRSRANFALQRAVELAEELGRPLVVLEALRVGYPWASDRIHSFVLRGMADNLAAFAPRSVTYLPYVEPEAEAGRGLLEALAEKASAVVGDDFPCFFLPRMHQAVAPRLGCRFELVDGNGLLPLRATERAFPTAYAFRRFLHKTLPGHLGSLPCPEPLDDLSLPRARVPGEILERWPMATEADLAAPEALAASLPLDHTVLPGVAPGGARAGAECLGDFLHGGLRRYGEDRNHPDRDGASGLSPYLHFGHVGAHEVFQAVVDQEDWSLDRVVAQRATGKRSGWWGLSESAESFLDELVTWRELAYNGAAHLPGFETLEGQPDWALRTMDEHRADPREYLYELDELDRAATHDPIWNAAQRQLVEEGRMHNYLRMLWGKKIYQWSESPEVAAAHMIELNNRYALDGRNPNSYSGIFWVLGRYDRAWGPERPVFGKLRYMTSESTRRKLRLEDYLARFGGPGGTGSGSGRGGRGKRSPRAGSDQLRLPMVEV